MVEILSINIVADLEKGNESMRGMSICKMLSTFIIANADPQLTQLAQSKLINK